MHLTLSIKNLTDRGKVGESSRWIFAIKLLFFTVTSVTSQNVFSQDSKAIRIDQERNGQMVIVPFNDALDHKFHPLHADRPNGPNLFVLEGDPSNGSSLTIFRYSKNYSGSGNLHNHPHDYKLWLIEGKMKHWDANGSEETAKILVPGSYIYQPADEFHAANCLSARCTAYVIFDGPIRTGFPGEKSMESERK